MDTTPGYPLYNVYRSVMQAYCFHPMDFRAWVRSSQEHRRPYGCGACSQYVREVYAT
jgi:hypothetical protein